MKFTPCKPPRSFDVGFVPKRISLQDCGQMNLEPDEQITFTTDRNGQYDVVRKSWGFYATPSLNRRLPQFGLRPALVESSDGTFFIQLMEVSREASFNAYLKEQSLTVVCWLDDGDVLRKIKSCQSAS